MNEKDREIIRQVILSGMAAEIKKALRDAEAKVNKGVAK